MREGVGGRGLNRASNMSWFKKWALPSLLFSYKGKWVGYLLANGLMPNFTAGDGGQVVRREIYIEFSS